MYRSSARSPARAGRAVSTQHTGMCHVSLQLHVYGMCYNVRVQVRVKAGHVATRVRPKWLLQPLATSSQPASTQQCHCLAGSCASGSAGWLAGCGSVSQSASLMYFYDSCSFTSSTRYCFKQAYLKVMGHGVPLFWRAK